MTDEVLKIIREYGWPVLEDPSQYVSAECDIHVYWNGYVCGIRKNIPYGERID